MCSILMSSVYICWLSLDTIILLLSSSLLIDARTISETCVRRVHGSNCHPVDKSWQHDGVCHYRDNDQKCIAPDTKRVELSIIAQYQTLDLRTAIAVKNMYIRGTGPGLSWETSIRMSKSASAIDIWTTKISYTIDSDGLTCISSTHCLLNQQFLEFRIYKDAFGREGMKGPNFYIHLPSISNTHSGAASFLTPSVTVYPWFSGVAITSRNFSMKMSDQILPIEHEIQFDCLLYYPPSYKENVRKKYPLVIIFDLGDLYYRPLLELLFVHEASVEEVAILLAVPNFPDNYTMLPFDNYELRCPTYDCSNCQTCWAKNRRDKCERDEFIAKAKRCLHFKALKGIGSQVMESAVKELTSKVRDYMMNRILYDPPRHRLTLIGAKDIGVSVFNEALINPHLVQYAASFSPSFFYPLDLKYNLNPKILENIEKEGIKTELDVGRQYLHYSQKFYIDRGENDDFYFPLDNLYLMSDRVIEKLKKRLKFEKYNNVIYQVNGNTERRFFMRNEPPPYTFHSLRFPLMAFHGSKGGLNKDYVKTIKVSPAFIAEQQGRLSLDGGGSVFNVISSNRSGNNTISIQVVNSKNCTTTTETKCDKTGMPLGLFAGAIAVSTAMSSVISVILMCLRESSRRAAEKEEKEERELLEELSSDDDLDDL